MATVTGVSADRVQAIEDAGIQSAGIDSNGHLNLTRNDGSIVDAGSFQAPTGAVQMFAGSVVPAGWLLCNGQALSRTTYAALFAVIGTAYGAGDGTTTFNIPNMELNFPRQQAAARGAVGGASTHSHTIPTHTHAGHTHSLTGGSPQAHAHINVQTGSGPNIQVDRVDVAAYTSDINANMTSATLTSGSPTRGAVVAGNTNQAGGSTVNTGGSPTDASSSLPPYVNFNFIIKA